MYVRDHTRPALHEALGFEPTAYDMAVFRITSEVSRQVFPVTLDIDDPRFLAGLDRLSRISLAMDAAKSRGGVAGGIRRLGLVGAAAWTFARLYFLPAKPNTLSPEIRLSPTW
jgi:magnesium-protoporphyrin IX monomethyl ester (oxidative) cyclase